MGNPVPRWEKILKLKAAGMSQRQIAKLFDISQARVCQLIKQAESAAMVPESCGYIEADPLQEAIGENLLTRK